MPRRWIVIAGLITLTLLALSARGRPGPRTPESIILIVADGTGVGQHTLSYYKNDRYSPAAFEHVGMMTTHPSTRNVVTDSAAAATAFATGSKTYNGAIAVDDARKPLKTIVEYAEEKGLATGLVATSTITHATPAAFAAHVASRGDEAGIARQMAGSDIRVLFGGGRKFFVPKKAGGEQETDLLAAMTTRGVQVVDALEQAVEPARRVVGLFTMDALPPAGEKRTPSTTAMALRAVDILDDDPDGFFLMVEESQVDWASHDNDEAGTLAEMASLNDLVDALLAYQARHPKVLVVLVADHETGGLSVKEGRHGGLEAGWVQEDHTSDMVPIFATGPGSDVFDAVVDNTFIGRTLIEYVQTR